VSTTRDLLHDIAVIGVTTQQEGDRGDREAFGV
jgi:hypothetical protein